MMKCVRVIIVLCLVTRCSLQELPPIELEKTIELLGQIREVIFESGAELQIRSSKYFVSTPSEEVWLETINTQEAAKIVSLKQNLHPLISNMSQELLYLPFLELAGLKLVKSFDEQETYTPTNNLTLMARSLLKMIVQLKTVVPMNRILIKASNRAAYYVLEKENLAELFSCFLAPEYKNWMDDWITSATIYKFTNLTYSYWLNTIIELVAEDAQLKSEFKLPMDSEMETRLFAFPPDKDQWSAFIVPVMVELQRVGDLDYVCMNYENYLLLRAMVQVADQRMDESRKLNEIFWTALITHRGNATVDGIFETITNGIEADAVLREQIKNTKDELTAINTEQQPPILDLPPIKLNKTIELLWRIRTVILKCKAEIQALVEGFKSQRNTLTEEVWIDTLKTYFAKIYLSQEHLRPLIFEATRDLSYLPFLNHAGLDVLKYYVELGTNVTKSEVRSLLKMTVELKTALPMNRILIKASSRTATYLLEREKLADLILCFTAPKYDLWTDDQIVSTLVYQFIPLIYPYWLKTVVKLVGEDARLKSEFQLPMDSEMETKLFAFPPDKDQWSASIIPQMFALRRIGDLADLDYIYENYLVLRAMVQVADQGTYESRKLNEIFWTGLLTDGGNATETEIFQTIKNGIEADVVLREQIKDAKDKLSSLKI